MDEDVPVGQAEVTQEWRSLLASDDHDHEHISPSYADPDVDAEVAAGQDVASATTEVATVPDVASATVPGVASEFNTGEAAHIATTSTDASGPNQVVPVGTMQTTLALRKSSFLMTWASATPLGACADRLTCMSCKLTCDPLAPGTRLRSKSAGVWQCGGCNSKSVIMSSALGAWPTPGFKAFTPEQKITFYRTESKNCKQEYAKTVALRTIQERSETCDGELRPLNYWLKLGYDEARLRAHTAPEDRGYTDQEGDTFRVKVHAQRDRNAESRIQDEIMNSMQQGRKKIQKEAMSELPKDRKDTIKDMLRAMAVKGKKRRDSAGSSSSNGGSNSSSSSSSSSSSGGKKSRKQKKAKKETKKNKKLMKNERKKKELAKKQKQIELEDEKKRKNQDKAQTAENKRKEKEHNTASRHSAQLVAASLNLAAKAITALQCTHAGFERLMFQDTDHEACNAAFDGLSQSQKAKYAGSFLRLNGLYEESQERLANTKDSVSYTLDDVRMVAKQSLADLLELSKLLGKSVC
jgi:uncharacterized membrane protein YgcG